MAFLLAAAVVVDYLLPSNSRYLWLVGVGAVALGLGLKVRSDSRLVRNLQTLALTSVLSLAIAILGVEIAFRVFLLRPAVPDNVRDFERHIAAYWPTPVEPKASLTMVWASDWMRSRCSCPRKLSA